MTYWLIASFAFTLWAILVLQDDGPGESLHETLSRAERDAERWS